MEYINIAFTGHRPNRLYGYDLNNPRYKQLSKILKRLLDEIDYDNPGKGLKGIVGGALGFDTLAYNTLYNKKISGEFPEYNSLKIEMAIPFRNQNIKWNYIDKVKYSFCLEHSDKITYVDKEEKYKIKGVQEDIYHISKMQKRNEYMVDLQTMRRIYKEKGYSDKQLLQIRDFLYNVAQMRTKTNEP